MKKFTTLLFASLLSLVSTLSTAQLKSDFKGTWVGTGSDGSSDNVYELKLNADATCSFKINGVEAYNITNYRIESFPPTELDDNIQSPVRNVLFQTNIHNSADNNSGTFTGNGTSKYVIYKGELKFTDVDFSHLQVTFKTQDNGEQLTYNLTR